MCTELSVLDLRDADGNLANLQPGDIIIFHPKDGGFGTAKSSFITFKRDFDYFSFGDSDAVLQVPFLKTIGHFEQFVVVLAALVGLDIEYISSRPTKKQIAMRPREGKYPNVSCQFKKKEIFSSSSSK